MADYRERIAKLAAEQDRRIVSLASNFERALYPMVQTAQGRVIVRLAEQLKLNADGVIDPTPENLRRIRSLDRLWNDLMKEAGYPELVDAYVQRFDGNLPMFQEVLRTLSDSMKTPLPPVEFTAKDLRAFSAFRTSTAVAIEAVVETVGNHAARQALLSINGLSLRELTDVLSQQFSRSISEASGLAATSMATHYRTIAKRGYEIIEAEQPEVEIRYTYEGPLDKLTRPFCRKLKQVNKAWTRKEIDAMSNGSSLNNVFVTCGGWNCRHQWVLYIPEALLLAA